MPCNQRLATFLLFLVLNQQSLSLLINLVIVFAIKSATRNFNLVDSVDKSGRSTTIWCRRILIWLARAFVLKAHVSVIPLFFFFKHSCLQDALLRAEMISDCHLTITVANSRYYHHVNFVYCVFCLHFVNSTINVFWLEMILHNNEQQQHTRPKPHTFFFFCFPQPLWYQHQYQYLTF